MAYNVISCRKVAENTQILKIAQFAINLAPDLRNHQKKAQKTDHSIAIYSNF